MAKVGYYILTSEQVNILTVYGYSSSIVDVGGKSCVTEWDSIYQDIMDQMNATYDDDDPTNDAPDAYFDIMDSQVNYMYWSTEAHSWV